MPIIGFNNKIEFSRKASELNAASYHLILILLTIGIYSPPGLGLSSLSILMMALAALHLGLVLIIKKAGISKKFLMYNGIVVVLILFYTIISLIKGKLQYPSYPLIILFFQFVFFLITLNVNAFQLVKVFKIVILINFFFYLIQIVGSILEIESLLKLNFIGANKSNIEKFGFLPRASGLINEPAHLSYLLLPLIGYFILDNNSIVKIRRIPKTIIYLLYLCTFSVIAYTQVIVFMLYKVFKKASFQSLVVFSILLCLFIGLFLNIAIFSNRINGIFAIANGETTNETSVLSLQSNFLVMYDVFIRSPFLGDGLTSHRANYNIFIHNHFPGLLESDWLGLNQNDAGSLIILLVSETGLLGLLGFLTFIILSMKTLAKDFLGLSFLISLLLISLRFGNIASVYIMFYLMIILKALSVRLGGIKVS